MKTIAAGQHDVVPRLHCRNHRPRKTLVAPRDCAAVCRNLPRAAAPPAEAVTQSYLPPSSHRSSFCSRRAVRATCASAARVNQMRSASAGELHGSPQACTVAGAAESPRARHQPVLFPASRRMPGTGCSLRGNASARRSSPTRSVLLRSSAACSARRQLWPPLSRQSC